MDADKQKPLPFELGEDERLLLSGGFGGVFAWVWSIPLVGIGTVVALLLIAGIIRGIADTVEVGQGILLVGLFGFAGLWPFFRSGTYWLTDRRLLWNPRLGKPAEIALVSLLTDRIKVGPITSSLQVCSENRKISLRFIGGLERLWGALLLFCDPFFTPQSEALAAIAPDYLVWKAWRVDGMSAQKGFAVFRCNDVAFLPSERAMNILREISSELGLAAVGLSEVRLQAKFPFDLWIEALRRRAPAEFDQSVGKVAVGFGGLVLNPGDAKLVQKNIACRSRHKALWITQGKTSVRVPAIPLEILAKFAAVLDAWR